MSWRPDGWENPYTYHNLEAKPANTGIDVANVPEMVAYEAGADAMLKAIVLEMEEFGSHHSLQIFIEKVIQQGQGG